MFVILAMLSLVIAGVSQTGGYSLTPTTLPAAYQGQYYTVQFRVTGLSGAVFKYLGLPADLTGSQNGTVEGTPSRLGSFPVEVRYTAGNISSGTNIVMQVSAVPSLQQALNSSAVTGFQVVTPASSFTYVAGWSVSMQLKAEGRAGPYIWSATNLPPGIFASTSGLINGSFIESGYYTVSVMASDSIGRTASAYYVFNVQPAEVGSGGQLVEVQSRNPKMHYNLTQLEQQQVDATKAVYAAGDVMNRAQVDTTVQREVVADTTRELVRVTQLAKQAEERAATVMAAKLKAEGLIARAAGLKRNATNLAALANTSYNNAFAVYQSGQQLIKAANSAFQMANQALKQASTAFITAQNDSMQASSSLKLALSQNMLANQAYNSSFGLLVNAKRILSAQEDNLVQANSIVQSIRNLLSVANQANDDATSGLTMARTVYQKTQSILNSTVSLVAGFTKLLSDAGDQLGQAKFSLQQATGGLMVAQAAKEQADRATLLVSMQSAEVSSGSVDSSLFAGCQQGAYPSVGGSVVVQQVEVYGLDLASGKTLLFGDCTAKTADIAKGDLINFIGYLKDGFIMGLTIRKEV